MSPEERMRRVRAAIAERIASYGRTATEEEIDNELKEAGLYLIYERLKRKKSRSVACSHIGKNKL